MSLETFATTLYRDHNRARLAHLDSLGLDLEKKRVLEVGAGPGDHTGFYLRKECEVVALDARAACLELLLARHPRGVTARVVDMNQELLDDIGYFDIVHCYGLLYHLEKPEVAIFSMARVCRGTLLLETCVSMGDGLSINLVPENASDFTQALRGFGCRPTRQWVFEELKKYFPHVYQTRTQPNHPEFPVDWSESRMGGLTRAVFAASHEPLPSATFSPTLVERHGEST